MSRWNNFLTKFNSVYDFISRIVKGLVFLAIVAILLWKLPFINWGRTSNELINKYTSVQVESPKLSSMSDTTTRQERLITENPKPRPLARRSSPQVRTLQTEKPNLDYLGVYQFGQLVFTVDKPYDISTGTFVFDKLLIKGNPDYQKNFLYAGVEIKITRIAESIGLLVSGGSVEGPLLRGVSCQVVRR